MSNLVKVILILCLTLSVANSWANTLQKPLSNPDRWLLLEYSSLEPNKVEFSDNRMLIEVDNSASPIIYPFDSPQSLEAISLKLKLDGQLMLEKPLQGSKGNDDFVFRLGVVYEGEQTLNFFQKAIAAKWVKQLFALAPKGTGVDHISFFNVYSDDRLAGKDRTHPASDLMKETFQDTLAEGKAVSFQWHPDPEKKVLGLWISSDGDDTDSNYSVEISDLQLHRTK
ncbi:hypothetical protein EOPP23_07890 [Endozoicomonas sp. OPT23]|uniref:hypothetical protein n=1 Tax=Endozoicomonas sp. OPT23 TaxID=2072845 RepID=UPI00129B92CF|nr:hypothetical protein [Endozoicomonas sp. OPT23]MRI32904.1 hypothetical protein [Endozoicomonas sp. OPT23]